MTILAQSQQSNGRHAVPTPSPPSDSADASLGELTARLSAQMARLVRDELELAQLEGKQRAKRIGAGVGMFGVGGMFAFFGACCGVAAIVLGLCNVTRPWLAALITASALMFLALLTVLPGWKSIKQKHPDVPHDTIASVKQDVATFVKAAKR